MKLLNIDANAKTVKGQKRGYMTAVLYLAPYKASGWNTCPMAEAAGCWQGCLNTAGRGGIAKGGATRTTPCGELPDNAIQNARIERTRLYFEDREGFMYQLEREILAFIKKAARANLTPAIRLNGTSDIAWEKVPAGSWPNIMARFPDVQFYDYTKVMNRGKLPSNYDLSLSYSEASKGYTLKVNAHAEDTGRNRVVVFRDKVLPETFEGIPVVSGDESDLRFLDPKGVVIGLYAKGRARKDTSGFVIG